MNAPAAAHDAGQPGAAADPASRLRYEALRELLRHDGTALQLMADLEADLFHHERADPDVFRTVRRLVDETLMMAEELNLLSGGRHRVLYRIVDDIRGRLWQLFDEASSAAPQPLAVDLVGDAEADQCLDARLVGGKAAGLAVLRQRFPEDVPPAFVVTVAGYRALMAVGETRERVQLLTRDLDAVTDRDQFRLRAAAAREAILSCEVPPAILDAIGEHARAVGGGEELRWAVRSSAAGEDGSLSFAGQFESVLNVAPEDLGDAYRRVVASRFADSAIRYRLHWGFREADTSMAVLFMPMIDAKAAGVVYTADPRRPPAERMVVQAVPGLADRLVRGECRGELAYLSRAPAPELLPDEEADADAIAHGGRVPVAVLREAGRLALSAAQELGHELDVEWAADAEGKVWLLQGRRLRSGGAASGNEPGRLRRPPLIEAGHTLVPGRAEGPVVRLESPDVAALRGRAAVAVIDEGTPDFAPILPHVAALVIRHGNPVGHLSTLVREFAVPCIYRMGDAADLLRDRALVSVDASLRRVHRGSIWPGMRERVRSRIAEARQDRGSGPLTELVLSLSLSDPFVPTFRADGCRSLHDVIRFAHEMSVRLLFREGDRLGRPWSRKARTIESPMPVKLRLVDLDGSAPPRKGTLRAEDVSSTPFRALWRGIEDEEVSWEPPNISSIAGLPPSFAEALLAGPGSPRGPRDASYVVVASDYLNLNARFAYHYAMVDSLVGPGKERNHVHFRYRGGAGSAEGRLLRARWLEEVLRRLHFGVDRRGDLVTAWLRGYATGDCEGALEGLGRLMACSRQLDMELQRADDLPPLVESFLSGRYRGFG